MTEWNLNSNYEVKRGDASSDLPLDPPETIKENKNQLTFPWTEHGHFESRLLESRPNSNRSANCDRERQHTSLRSLQANLQKKLENTTQLTTPQPEKCINIHTQRLIWMTRGEHWDFEFLNKPNTKAPWLTFVKEVFNHRFELATSGLAYGVIEARLFTSSITLLSQKLSSILRSVQSSLNVDDCQRIVSGSTFVCLRWIDEELVDREDRPIPHLLCYFLEESHEPSFYVNSDWLKPAVHPLYEFYREQLYGIPIEKLERLEKNATPLEDYLQDRLKTVKAKYPRSITLLKNQNISPKNIGKIKLTLM